MKNGLAEIMAAEDKRDAALKDIMRRIFQQFDSQYVCLGGNPLSQLV